MPFFDPPTETKPGAVSAAVSELQAAAEFLRSPFFTAQVVQGIQQAAARAVSPWVDRAGAAAYALCSVSEIDRAAKAGVITKHERVGTPMFLKAEIDEAIRAGKWGKAESEKRKPMFSYADGPDGRCADCEFLMLGGASIGLCPKCGGKNWFKTKITL